MSKQYDNELKGVLFKNEDKQSDTHADYRGSATVAGVDYFLDAWINTAESGRKYMSLRLKPKDKQQGRDTGKTVGQRHQERTADYKQPKPNRGFEDMDDDIPF